VLMVWICTELSRMDNGRRRGSEVIRSGRIQMALCLARERRWRYWGLLCITLITTELTSDLLKLASMVGRTYNVPKLQPN
jgi:hypothetical protein